MSHLDLMHCNEDDDLITNPLLPPPTTTVTTTATVTPAGGSAYNNNNTFLLVDNNSNLVLHVGAPPDSTSFLAVAEGSSNERTRNKPTTSTPSSGKKNNNNTNNNNNNNNNNMFRSRKASDPRQKRHRRRKSSSGLNPRIILSDSTATTISSSTTTSSTTKRMNHHHSSGGFLSRCFHCLWQWLTRSPTVAANAILTSQQQQQQQLLLFQQQLQLQQTPSRSSRWMGFLARGVLWTTIVSLSVAVIWYSYELFNHGTDPHLVAWFSAGGFVLLGFPISMWSIISHLANYNQPHVQVYIVRILWMVPLYSVGSWLAMRFRPYAIYIETVRDLYESYVLYSFLQFLIQVLGGEEALVLMLKDKSPTRGVHMWGLQLCVKPWLMGQPHRKTFYEREDWTQHLNNTDSLDDNSNNAATNEISGTTDDSHQKHGNENKPRAVKRILWKSPFFVRCKFGVLQYVLLKFILAICIMILEHLGWYREGDFTPRGGYLYICFITNLSQCWAVYCLVFFYYATHNELSPIRPVGKFLSVKALVFFTWWQSVMISYLLWMDLIPEYRIQRQDWTSEDVAKGLQDYLICIEMFLIAIVHSFVFPHSEYTPQAVEARSRALNQAPMTKWQKKRLGRSKYSSQYLLFGKAADDHSANTPSLGTDVETELVSLGSEPEGWSPGLQFSSQFTHESPQSFPTAYSKSLESQPTETPPSALTSGESAPPLRETGDNSGNNSNVPLMDITEREDEEEDDEEDDEESDSAVEDDESENGDEEATILTTDTGSINRRGFMRAFLETAIPTDMVDSTVGIVKGDYNVERKTLLNHATTSDQYDLFSPNRRPFAIKKKQYET